MFRRWTAGLAVMAALFVAVSPAQASKPRSKAERAFLTEMVGHHQMAVDMAEMAMMRATHPELKDLAESIITTQTAEQEKMQTWLKRWYGKTATPEMGHHEMMQMEELEASATAAEFEVRFLAMMTMHHTQAVERATAVKRARIHGATRKLADDIIDAQMAEIEQMRAWLVAWYAN